MTVRLRADQWSEGVEYLNPDDVARDRFGDWNSPEATLEAARWTTARREALLAAHQGIAFEITIHSGASRESTQDRRRPGSRRSWPSRLARQPRTGRRSTEGVYAPVAAPEQDACDRRATVGLDLRLWGDHAVA